MSHLFKFFGLLLLSLISMLIAWVIYVDWRVSHWDKRIDALCAANGGKDVAVRVYETAMAPETKEYFRDLKPIRGFFIPERRKGVTLGPEFPFVMETRVIEVLHEKDPSVVKYTERIVRVSDNKILAERFGYQRAGGDLALWDPGEIRNCPKDNLSRSLDVNVFVNHPRRDILGNK